MKSIASDTAEVLKSDAKKTLHNTPSKRVSFATDEITTGVPGSPRHEKHLRGNRRRMLLGSRRRGQESSPSPTKQQELHVKREQMSEPILLSFGSGHHGHRGALMEKPRSARPLRLGRRKKDKGPVVIDIVQSTRNLVVVDDETMDAQDDSFQDNNHGDNTHEYMDSESQIGGTAHQYYGTTGEQSNHDVSLDDARALSLLSETNASTRSLLSDDTNNRSSPTAIPSALRKSSMSHHMTFVRSSLLEKGGAEELRELEERIHKKMRSFWKSEPAMVLYCFLTAVVVSPGNVMWIVNGSLLYILYSMFTIVAKWVAYVTNDSQVMSFWHFIEKCREHASRELGKTVQGGNGRRRQEALMLITNGIGAYYGTVYFSKRSNAMFQRSLDDHKEQMKLFREHS